MLALQALLSNVDRLLRVINLKGISKMKKSYFDIVLDRFLKHIGKKDTHDYMNGDRLDLEERIDNFIQTLPMSMERAKSIYQNGKKKIVSLEQRFRKLNPCLGFLYLESTPRINMYPYWGDYQTMVFDLTHEYIWLSFQLA